MTSSFDGFTITAVVSAGASDLMRNHGDRKCPQYRRRSIDPAPQRSRKLLASSGRLKKAEEDRVGRFETNGARRGMRLLKPEERTWLNNSKR
jgi:hypothetical protein